MSLADIYQYDLKGNQIQKLSNVCGVNVGVDVPVGIDTDGNNLIISFGNGVKTIYTIDKKGNQLRSFDPGTIFSGAGITTNGRDLIWSSNFSGAAFGLSYIDRKNNINSFAAGFPQYLGMAFNGRNVLATISGTFTFDILDKSFKILKNVRCGAVDLTGICSIGRQVVVLDTNYLVSFYDYTGQLLSSFSLPTPGTEVYTDLTFDGRNLWILGYDA